MDIEFCNTCGKVLAKHEEGMLDCEMCEYTEPDIDIDAEYDEFDDESGW